MDYKGQKTSYMDASSWWSETLWSLCNYKLEVYTKPDIIGDRWYIESMNLKRTKKTKRNKGQITIKE